MIMLERDMFLIALIYIQTGKIATQIPSTPYTKNGFFSKSNSNGLSNVIKALLCRRLIAKALHAGRRLTLDSYGVRLTIMGPEIVSLASNSRQIMSGGRNTGMMALF
jgi:hypothetical protein